MRRTIGLLGLLAALTPACGAESAESLQGKPEPPGSDVSGTRAVTQLTAALEPVVRGHNAFALDVYARVAGVSESNVFMSPLSIEAALALVERGTAGETANEFKRALHVEGDEATYHREFGRLLRDLGGQHEGRGYELHIANGLFLNETFDVHAEYVDQVKEDYETHVQRVVFPEPALADVNGWISEQTHGFIPELFDFFLPMTQAAMANAIYFEGQWAQPFDAESISDSSFRISADETKQVPMMTQSAEFSCGGDERTRVIELDYAGQDLSMVVFVPGDGTDLFGESAYAPLATLEADLSAARIDTLLSTLDSQKVTLTLPKFKARSAFDLIALLKQMGIEQAFGDRADFSRLADAHLKVGQALHEAYVEVDERGTRAAAATAVTVFTRSAQPRFVVDQPFVFMIRDKLTNSILFMGRIMDPTKN